MEKEMALYIWGAIGALVGITTMIIARNKLVKDVFLGILLLATVGFVGGMGGGSVVKNYQWGTLFEIVGSIAGATIFSLCLTIVFHITEKRT